MLEQRNVCCHVATKLHEMKTHTMVHGIRGVLYVQLQQDYKMLGVALVIKKTLQLEQLVLCAAALEESHLYIFQELVTIHKEGHPLVNNVKKCDKF